MPRLTEFGKRCRQLRLELDILLKEMADALGVSSAYLSAVELGKKPPTDKLTADSIAFFRGRGLDATDLTNAAIKTRKEVRINIEHAPEPRRELAVAFARRFDGLTQEEVMTMLRSLNTRRNDEQRPRRRPRGAHVSQADHSGGD